MGIHYKVDGAWTEVNRVFVKREGVWLAADTVYVKRDGTFQPVLQFDHVPPSAPIITTELISGRYVKVGVRLPDAANVADVRRIRLLTTYNGKSPTTQYGGNFTSEPADEAPNEPYSEFYYNGFAGVTTRDTSVPQYKNYPRNATEQTQLPKGTEYFAAWAEDYNGNWSAGTYASINIPASGVVTSINSQLSGRFNTTATGSFTSQFVFGKLVQSTAPVSRGAYFYGNQFKNAIGLNGSATIKSAQIYVQREDDGGRPTANVWLGRHNYGSPDNITGSYDLTDVQLIGYIGKGESAWLNIPESMYPALAAGQLKGFGLSYRDPNGIYGAMDFSVLSGYQDAPRTGEVNVVWEEKL